MLFAGVPWMTPVIFTLATKVRKAGLASATAATSELVAETPGASVADAVAAGLFAMTAPFALLTAPAFPAVDLSTAGLSGTS